ncbi:histidine phosphatase superfamily [Lasiosphaeris hirsuta]|uniref:Histidine phosphatase superfamily n=1 Tax=Lasiosphaeris hirsuta TaxID=260670 RepID=A0AA40A1Y4_9PEZI|nr:histidine phosphatase superfamily [Lasiosphaeris hirsuta]
MPPTLILVRHAEALHNATRDWFIHDPVLSELGRQQCAELKDHMITKIPSEIEVDLIIVSPMIRTLETALLSFGPFIEQGVPIRAHAGWQETTAKPCDTGTPISQLEAQFPQVDFSGVDPVFPDKTSPAGAAYKFSKQAIMARGHSCLRELYNRPEKVIVVVSHSGFLKRGISGHYYFNADYRIFDFETEGEPETYLLKQWEATKKGGLGWSLEETVQVGDELPE